MTTEERARVAFETKCLKAIHIIELMFPEAAFVTFFVNAGDASGDGAVIGNIDGEAIERMCLQWLDMYKSGRFKEMLKEDNPT